LGLSRECGWGWDWDVGCVEGFGLGVAVLLHAGLSNILRLARRVIKGLIFLHAIDKRSRWPLACLERALPHTGEEAQCARLALVETAGRLGFVLCLVAPAPPPWINHPTTSCAWCGEESQWSAKRVSRSDRSGVSERPQQNSPSAIKIPQGA
jgi:hypothetical protein